MRTAANTEGKGFNPRPGDIFLLRFGERPGKPILVSGQELAPEGKTSVLSRMTVRKLSIGEGKFIHKSGGKGQHGHVVIKLQPHFQGGGVKIVNEVPPVAIPPQFVTIVIATLAAACEQASEDSYPLTDVIIRIVDGSYAEADSSDLSFKMAAMLALMDAKKGAEPYVFDLSGEAVYSNERVDIRPAVIVSRSDLDGSIEPVIAVPLTTRSSGSIFEVAVGKQPFLDREMWAYVRGVAAFERTRLKQFLGCVTPEQLRTIRGALKYSLDL